MPKSDYIRMKPLKVKARSEKKQKAMRKMASKGAAAPMPAKKSGKYDSGHYK